MTVHFKKECTFKIGVRHALTSVSKNVPTITKSLSTGFLLNSQIMFHEVSAVLIKARIRIKGAHSTLRSFNNALLSRYPWGYDANSR